MQVRSFEKPFGLVDYTETLNLVPNTWGLINSMGLFRNEPVSQHSITVELSEGTLSLMSDTTRGVRNNVNKDDTRKLYSFPVPHFTLDDYLTPHDLQDIRAYGQTDAAETEAAVVLRKMERIRKIHGATLEMARAYAITTGGIYAPNGTVSNNYYSTFGVTRKEVDFELDSGTTDVRAKVEEVIAHIQDNIMTGENISGVTGLCSPEFFAALVGHARVEQAFLYFQSQQDFLRSRLGGNTVNRPFHFCGIDFIEYRGSYKDASGTSQRIIPANDVYFVPMGTDDTFITYFGPANKRSLVNTLGEEAYMFINDDGKDANLLIETETNPLCLVRRPQAVVRGVRY